MATLPGTHTSTRSDDGFFLAMAVAMAATIFVAFIQAHLRGFSTFNSPLIVHAHAVTFMGWVVIYLAQNWFATRGPIALHRQLGWVAASWLVLMLVLGTAVTVYDVRMGRTPPIFQPLHFLVFDPVMLIGAMVLFYSGIALRRRTDWHRRLNLCGMAILTGPAFGRLLPMPLFIPWAYHAALLCTFIWPVIGIIADQRREGRIHPAWAWGIGGMLATEAVTDIISFSPIGLALYRLVTVGSIGETIAPLAFPPLPGA